MNGVGDARNVCSDAADARWAKIFPPSLRSFTLGEKGKVRSVEEASSKYLLPWILYIYIYIEIIFYTRRPLPAVVEEA